MQRKIQVTTKFLSSFVGYCCFALIQSVPAYADWSLFATVKGTKVYVQEDRNGDVSGSTIFVLYDYGEKGEYGDLSSIHHYETNCKTGYVRDKSFQYFDGEMGRGAVVKNGADGTEWDCPVKGSLLARIAAITCENQVQMNEKSTIDLINQQYLESRCSRSSSK